jgi:membrane-bound lytic murein transglycosylase D
MEEPLPMTNPCLRARQHLLQAAALGFALIASGCASLAPPPQTDAPPIVVTSPVPLPDIPAPPVVEAPSEPYVPGPVQPRGRLDPAQDAERSDLWQRVREGFALPDVEGELVQKWEQWYARDPAYVQRMAERGGRYLFHIVEEVQRRGMPSELALLPFIESAYNPQAMSRAAASGMWQFMPGTGKDFELRQNVFRDDRRDVLASTRAALDYLQRLNTMFGGDWQLALAAYNWGPGNLQKALERNRRAGLPADYASLRLPVETREYVPKLQAVKNIVRHPEAYGLALPPLENHPFFLGVDIQRDIDVDLAARLAGLTLEEFQQLNPQLNKPVILAAGTPRVLLPYDNANQYLRALADYRGALASWTAWVAPRTLKPAEAARLAGMSEAQLRAVNLIPPRMLVRAGSTLLVARKPHTEADVAGHIAENATMALAPEAPPLRRVSVKAAQHGESVAALARRYKLGAAQVAQWNGTSAQAHFKGGQTVVLMLPPAAAAGRSRPLKVAARSGAGSGRSTRPAARARVVAQQVQASQALPR